MRRAILALALVAAALAPGGARAQTPSPRSGSFELGGGTFYPDTDRDFSPGQLQTIAECPAASPCRGPWQQMFGNGRRWQLRFGITRTLLHERVGSLDVGFRTGYAWASAHGFQNNGTPEVPVWVRAGESTRFQMIPTSVTLTYRIDYLADRLNIPFAPYGRLALERYNWWISDGAGKTSRKGATNGWSMTGGLALLLDWFDSGLARDLDRESGVNHTYLFFDVTRSKIDDFGQKSAWDLSEKHVAYTAGLLFVY
jgi:hypothetical protein